MRIIIAAFVFAALVVYGEKAKAQSKASEHNSAAAKQQSDGTGTGTVIVVNQQTTKGEEQRHEAKAPSYHHELLLPQNLPNLALVMIGIFAVAMAYHTLRALKRQIDAVVSSERARVVPELVRYTDLVTIGLRLVNMGRTVAQISGYEMHCGFFDWKRQVLRIGQINSGGVDKMLGGSENIEVAGEIVDIDRFVRDKSAGLDTYDNWLVLLVVVRYRHVFSGTEPEAYIFRFVYTPTTKSFRREEVTDADRLQAREKTISPVPQDGDDKYYGPN
ncbi:MAG TPA: hypothetical protein VG206_05280 [Terriglobia bacterium]|nr:hypothetical protein [Terriglobia bacterium]